MKIEEDKFSAPFILIPLLLIYTLDILKMRVLSYDNEFVYLKGVIKEQQLDYSAIIKAKRVLFRSYDISELNFGYKLVYMN